MKSSPLPYRKTVLVCANTREGGAQACGNPDRAGAALCGALKAAVKAAGLAREIRVVRAGCLGLCAQGPNVLILPEGPWLSGASEADLPEILRLIGVPRVGG
ncbi:MAG TPA: ferredoxin [Elusimicrobia bacterium]|nr:ferredoxin [Elusimicrobiota bacterium]